MYQIKFWPTKYAGETASDVRAFAEYGDAVYALFGSTLLKSSLSGVAGAFAAVEGAPEGEVLGVIRDFPGNYSDYRAAKEEEKRAEAARQKETAKPRVALQPRPSNPNKMTFKERKEFEALDAEIAQLTAEKEELDALFNSGDVIADIAAKSSRYDEVCRMLDEKEMRWLELSEKV